MKFFLVLLVVLAVAHGSEAASLMMHDAQAEVDRLTQLIKNMTVSVTVATQDMMEKIQALDMTNTAQNYMEDSRAKIQPLVEKVQAEAAILQGQVQPYISNIEEHIKPLTENFSAHVKPLTDNFHAQVKPLSDLMEKLFQQVVDQSKALLPTKSS